MRFIPPPCADRVESGESQLTSPERQQLACAEGAIRDAMYLMSSRMEGRSIVESYGAAYRVLFSYLYPEFPLPNASTLEAW